MHNDRFVDPSDPTKVFLSQPVDESQRLPVRPPPPPPPPPCPILLVLEVLTRCCSAS